MGERPENLQSRASAVRTAQSSERFGAGRDLRGSFGPTAHFTERETGACGGHPTVDGKPGRLESSIYRLEDPTTSPMEPGLMEPLESLALLWENKKSN